jgi:hypothetical protein
VEAGDGRGDRVEAGDGRGDRVEAGDVRAVETAQQDGADELAELESFTG